MVSTHPCADIWFQTHFWPELLQTLWECVQNTDVAHKENALYIFSVVPSLFGSELNTYLNEIKAMLLGSLRDTAHVNVSSDFSLIAFRPTQCIHPAFRKPVIVLTFEYLFARSSWLLRRRQRHSFLFWMSQCSAHSLTCCLSCSMFVPFQPIRNPSATTPPLAVDGQQPFLCSNDDI